MKSFILESMEAPRTEIATHLQTQHAPSGHVHLRLRSVPKCCKSVTKGNSRLDRRPDHYDHGWACHLRDYCMEVVEMNRFLSAMPIPEPFVTSIGTGTSRRELDHFELGQVGTKDNSADPRKIPVRVLLNTWREVSLSSNSYVE